MLHLTLMRHAKSGWDDPTLDDHDRPLNDRGLQSAVNLGGWLNSKSLSFDTVLCSSAKRTRQTLDSVSQSVILPDDTQFLPSIYLASAEQMLEILSSASGNSVLIVGHNPGIASLAEMFAAQAPYHPQWSHYPSGATTVMKFTQTSWADIKPDTATVEAFIVPRELEA
jgi:phosphohistidine phosphatase